MVDVRTAAASLLGIGLGIILIVSPDLAVRVHTAGRLPSDRQGEYGDDAAVPTRWRRLSRILGVTLVVVGLWFARAAFL